MKVSNPPAEGFAVGDVKFSAMPTPDLSSWLLCDGRAVSRATYAALFGAVATTYGVGDGATTFNLPDGAKILAAYKALDADFGTVGGTGGAKTHALTIAELAEHHHTIQKTTTGSGTNGFAQASNVGDAGLYNTSDVGTGAAHSILNPFLVMKMLIKYQ
jgi:microcystin-dependent protein